MKIEKPRDKGKGKGRRGRGLRGTTLIELLIAVCILGIAVGPMLLFMEYSTANSVRLRDRSVATYVAKMRMEELINLSPTEIDDYISDSPKDESGYEVTVRFPDDVDLAGGHGWIHDPATPTSLINFNELSEITVEVRNKDGVLLCEYTDVIFTKWDGVGP